MLPIIDCDPNDSVSLRRWLAQRLTGNISTELVTNHPWAITYRVNSSEGIHYVKQLPECQRAALPAMELISHLFSTRVPKVVSACFNSGFLLSVDHQGKSLHSLKDRDRSLELIQLYAQLQVEAALHEKLLSILPNADLSGLEGQFLDFFSTVNPPTGEVGAAHFIGDRKAAYYFDRLAKRIHLLKPLIELAQTLPRTINHCDLRPQNVAVRCDDSLVLFDWDDAIVGPAGLSLHNFFDGCSLAILLLANKPLAEGSDPKYSCFMDSYLSTLVDGGYSGRCTLENGLAGSICAGVMRYLLSYSKFPTDDEDFRYVVAKIIRRRTDDLLFGCDTLAMNDREKIISFVIDYEKSEYFEPAEQLLRAYVRGNPCDTEMKKHLATNLFQSGKFEEAERVCRRLLEIDPNHSGLRFLLGKIGLEQLDLDSTVDQWILAKKFGFEHERLDAWIEDVRDLQHSYRAASERGIVPGVKCSTNDDEFGTFSRLRTKIATGLFREYGTLLVEDVFSTEMLNALQEEFTRRYWPQLREGNPSDALQVGNRRFMVTLDLAGPFNDACLYASPMLISVFSRLLGNDFVLGSFTAVTALPGAADMRMHKDHPALFHTKECNQPLPTFAVTMLVPLLGLNAQLGTTRVVKRSHFKSSEESAGMEYQDPLGPKGSCLLMDYRLSHQGLANQSDRVRPVLSLVYNRSWFRDSANYKKQQPLQMSRQEFERVPDKHRYLFDWLFHNS